MEVGSGGEWRKKGREEEEEDACRVGLHWADSVVPKHVARLCQRGSLVSPLQHGCKHGCQRASSVTPAHLAWPFSESRH